MDGAAHPSVRRVTESVLRAYYPVVATLQTYLKAILEDDGLCLEPERPEISRFRSLLETTYVASNSTSATPRRYAPIPPMCHMQDVCIMLLLLIVTLLILQQTAH